MTLNPSTVRTGVRPNPLADLTPRELQTLSLLAQGKPYGRIADELNVSYKTVVNACSQLKQKLNAKNLPELILAVDALNRTLDPKQAVALIREHRLTHEMVPGQLKQSPEVWAAMLESMPMTAMIRNLGKLTEVGVLAPFSAATKHVVEQLGSPERLRKARLHPLAVLVITISAGCIFGMVGLVLAAPLTSAAVHITHDLARARVAAGLADQASVQPT